MKNLFFSLFVSFILVGCADMTRTQSGALTGGMLGATAGAMMGDSGGDAFAGAAIGALAGGMIGNALDEQQQTTLQRENPATYQRISEGQPLAISDIIALSKAGVDDSIIMSQIDATRTVFRLSSLQIINLKDTGVSQRVINYMINTGRY